MRSIESMFLFKIEDFSEFKFELRYYIEVNIYMFLWCIYRFLTSLDLGYLFDALVSLLPDILDCNLKKIVSLLRAREYG